MFDRYSYDFSKFVDSYLLVNFVHRRNHVLFRFVPFVACFIVSIRRFPLYSIENRYCKDGNNDKYEKLNQKLKDVDLEWNEEYANENVDQDEKLNTFVLYNLRYILKFDKFNVMYDDDAKQTLNDIFSSYESNDMNKYPIELKYKKEKLLFIER